MSRNGKGVAVTTYIDNKAELHSEFWWLFRSWEYSKSDDVSDLVAFVNPAVDLRLLPAARKGLYYVPLEPLTAKESRWNDYPFINSIYFLTSSEARDCLRDYIYVMRTDNDCFLTRHFPMLRPRLATFGIGLYSQVPQVAGKLVELCGKWGIIPQFNNVGSTFISFTEQALAYNQVHMDYCERLLADEFQGGPGEWPGWFKGVLSMYAGNLAANAFFGANLVLGGLDCHCMSGDYMCSTDYHIHAWHTWDYFSKFRWRNGEYMETDFAKLDVWRISDYCLAIAGPGPV
jgi:hypothetical protein